MASEQRYEILYIYDMFGHPSRVTLAISSMWGISNYFPNILDASDAMEGVRNREIFWYLFLLLCNSTSKILVVFSSENNNQSLGVNSEWKTQIPKITTKLR